MKLSYLAGVNLCVKFSSLYKARHKTMKNFLKGLATAI